MNYPAAELRGIKMNFYLIKPYAEHRGILLIKSGINYQIWYALLRNNIKIPFPIRDVHLNHIERRFQAKALEAQKSSFNVEGLLGQA